LTEHRVAILGPAVVTKAQLCEMMVDALDEIGNENPEAVERNLAVVDVVFALTGNTTLIHMLEYQQVIEEANAIVEAKFSGQMN
jgi:hypothetical protein